MKRKALSRLARVKLFDEHGGVCHLCGARIHAERGEKWEVDHVIPLWAGGADEKSNMAPGHSACHVLKTSRDAPVKAKTDRVRAKHLGIKKPSLRRWPKRPFPKRKN